MSNQLYGYGMYYSGGNLVFETANNNHHTNYYANTGVTLHAGVWYHVVCTWNGTTVVTYLNGNQTLSAAQATPTAFSNFDFGLGKNLPSNTAGFPGTIDEVGVWGRVLSATEVMALYNAGAGVAYPFNGGTNTPPTASAGTSQSLPVNTTSTTLNGTGNSAGGTITNYAWVQTAGPTSGIIINPATSTTTGTTQISGLTNGNTYTFQLTVTDNHSLTGTSAVNVTVASSNSPLLTGLLSYWPLDESSGPAIDHAPGGNNNGTPTSVTQGAAGKINTAYAFNGTTSQVDMGASANLAVNTGTVSCWVYMPSLPVNDGIIFEKGDMTFQLYGYGMYYSGGNLVFETASGTHHTLSL